jgi:hypothetical protein
MDNEFLSIVEKLAILEGRIAPKESKVIVETSTKQKKPALFNNLKKDESAMPMVGGVEFAEDKMEEDVLGRVKASLADYLKTAEESIKQDKDLIAKKKQDLDLKKKELRDLDLQQESSYVDEDDEPEEEIGPWDRISDKDDEDDQQPIYIVLYDRDEETSFVGGIYQANGKWKEEVISGTPPYNWGGTYMGYLTHNDIMTHIRNDYRRGFEIAGPFDTPEEAEEYADYEFGGQEDTMEDPNQTPAGGEGMSTMSDPTYAESAPVKTMNVELDEDGGCVLVEIHGDERDGFCIKRAGKELPTRFKSLEECEIALEMYMARRKAQVEAEQSADYIDEA